VGAVHPGEVSVVEFFASRPSRGISRFLRTQFRPTTQINIEAGWVRRGYTRRNPPSVPPGTPQTNQWCAAHARRVTPAANPPYISACDARVFLCHELHSGRDAQFFLLPPAWEKLRRAALLSLPPARGKVGWGCSNYPPTLLLHTKFLNFSRRGNHTCHTPRFTISQNSFSPSPRKGKMRRAGLLSLPPARGKVGWGSTIPNFFQNHHQGAV